MKKIYTKIIYFDDLFLFLHINITRHEGLFFFLLKTRYESVFLSHLYSTTRYCKSDGLCSKVSHFRSYLPRNSFYKCTLTNAQAVDLPTEWSWQNIKDKNAKEYAKAFVKD